MKQPVERRLAAIFAADEEDYSVRCGLYPLSGLSVTGDGGIEPIGLNRIDADADHRNGELNHLRPDHSANGVSSSRASASISSRPIAASASSTLASGSGRTTLRAQSSEFRLELRIAKRLLR